MSNIGRGSGITTSAIQNNRQLHIDEAMTIRLYADEYAAAQCARGIEFCISADMAKAELTAETLRGVSDDFADVKLNTDARSFLNSLKVAGTSKDGQTLFGQLDRSSDEYRNSTINMANFGDGFDAPSTLDLYLTINYILGANQNGAIRGISGATVDLSNFSDSYTTSDLRSMMEGGFDLARTYEGHGYEYGLGWSKTGNNYDPQLSDEYYHAAGMIDANLARGVDFGGDVVDDLSSAPYPDDPNFNVFAYYHDRNLKGMASAAGGMAIGLTRGGVFKDIDIGTAFGKTAPKGGTASKASEKVTWVDESAGMSSRARTYDEGAMGSRSNIETRKGQAPALSRPTPDGQTASVRFDGVDGDVMVDRKLSVVTTPKAKNQVLRKSEALDQNGLSGRWEVPTQSQANRAVKMFDELGVKNITVKVVPE